MNDKNVTVLFNGGLHARIERYKFFQYDTGRKLYFGDVELPFSYEVHFANKLHGVDAMTQIGDSSGVDVPPAVLRSGEDVYAWLWLDGMTEGVIYIPVDKRARPGNPAPEPDPPDIIEQTLAVLNEGIDHVDDALDETEAARDEAVASAESAASSATSAQASATQATSSASNAATSALSASDSASSAASSASVASTKALEASDRATIALNSANIAQAAATTATNVLNNINDTVETALTEAKESGEFDGPKGDKGDPGDDGYSPIAAVTQTSSGATITITDQNGTTTASVFNGQDGATGPAGDDGISPTVTVTDITGGHRITITDADGAHSFDVMDGDVADAPVNDVQILDVSCVDDKIAKIPTATNNTVGVVSGGNRGVAVNSSQATPGQLMISPATLGVMKNPSGFSNSIYLPITASHEHEATFYGLAKAAGDATQSASSNSVGAYTDEAKAAIQTMLGVPSISDIPTIPVQSVNGQTGAVVLDAQDVGAYEKPATGIPASDLASGVIPTVPVQDVQVNGTSVLSNGVANVPVASLNTYGAVKVNADGTYGVTFRPDNDQLSVAPATDSYIKLGTDFFRAIAPARQHMSAFYGLAKAAGDTTQSQSSNAVGTYTDDAKVAIQKMLGIYEAPWELLNDITLTEKGRIDLTADANGTPYNLLGVFIRVYYVANLTTVTVGYARYMFDDINGHYINAETGKYTTSTNAQGKFIHVMREGTLAMACYSLRSATGSGQAWCIKDVGANGYNFNFGNIVRIRMNAEDVEPAGTQIKIYGQRAY